MIRDQAARVGPPRHAAGGAWFELHHPPTVITGEGSHASSLVFTTYACLVSDQALQSVVTFKQQQKTGTYLKNFNSIEFIEATPETELLVQEGKKILDMIVMLNLLTSLLKFNVIYLQINQYFT